MARGSALGGFLGGLNWRYRYKALRARVENLYVTLSGARAGARDAEWASRASLRISAGSWVRGSDSASPRENTQWQTRAIR
jgi:hypothetical protein